MIINTLAANHKKTKHKNIMKKFTILFLITLFFTGFSFAQSQRMVLAEELTSATCPPCASQNPAFNALLQANTDIITSIKYQMNWPVANGDPMYLHNPVDNNARRSYYGVNSIPWVAIDGDYYQGQPANVSQTLINNAADVSSPFNIQVQHYVTPDEDSIYLTTLIEATSDISGNLVAHNVIVEKEIHFSSPPGTTNEKDFFNVMKKMLPTASGTSLPSSMLSGDYIIMQYAWELANVYDNNELAAVVFVQNSTSKEVHQAGNSGIEALTPVYANDVELLDITNVTSTNCNGNITPHVTIRNNGQNQVTSLTINYSINGGEEQIYDWTGDLSFLQTAMIELSELTFNVADTNHLVITGVNPNGETDNYTKNNTMVYEMLRAPILTGTSIVFLTLDDNPEETTWEIKNSMGEVVQSGGPYETSGQKFEPITVSETDCYEFVIYDAGGNGTEYYAVVYGNNQVAFDGSNFGDLERNEFAMGTVSVDEIKTFTDMNVFPNPASDKLNINFYLPGQNEVTMHLTDLTGKNIINSNKGILNAGPHEFVLNTSQLTRGIYLLDISIGNEVYTQKVSVQ